MGCFNLKAYFWGSVVVTSIILGVFGVGEALSPPPSPPTTEYIDLEYTLDERAIFFPGRQNYELHRDVEGFNFTEFPEHIRFWMAEFSFCMGEHGGTHLDAPYHFNENGWKVGEIPTNRLVDIPAAVIDVERYVFGSPNPNDFKLEVSHILEHERDHGRIPLGGVVLTHFGWGRFYPDRKRYLGLQPDGRMSYPAFSGEAAKWLVEQRKIVGIGTDGPSADVGNPGSTPIAHMILCGSQTYILENVANTGYLLEKTRPHQIDSQYQYQLQQNPNSKCDLRLIVMPIKSIGTGGPVRITAYCKGRI